MLGRIDHLIAQHTDFAFETTLSTLSYLQLIKNARAKKYTVTLIFLWLANTEIAKLRVAKRVQEGGHNIPVDVIERRYERGLKNLPKFMEVVNDWYLYDNSGGEYLLVSKKVEEQIFISNFETWEKIRL